MPKFSYPNDPEDAKCPYCGEQMNSRTLWVGCYTKDNKIYHLNISADGDKLCYYWSDETAE